MKKNRRATVLIAVTIMIMVTRAYAKDNNGLLQTRWQHKELVVENRQSFTNELYLTNLSKEKITVTVVMGFEDGIFLTKKLPTKVILAAGQVTKLAIAGMRLLVNSEPYIITTTITMDNVAGETKASFVLLAEKLNSPVKALFDSHSKYFVATDDTITIPLKIQNYTAQKQGFAYLINDEANGLGYLLEDTNPWLEAYESKVLLLKIFRNQQFKEALSYKMNVEIYDGLKNPILQSFVPIQSISSFYKMNRLSTVQQGELSVEYSSLKNIYNVSDIRYADKINLGTGNLSFQFRHQYYFGQRISQFFNSHVQWRNAANIVRVGEIYTKGELTNYGNGVYVKHSNKNSAHELWGIFNSGLVYSSSPFLFGRKNAFGYSFTKTGKNTVTQYQVGYMDDANTGGYGPILYAKQSRDITNGRLEVGFGTSQEFSKSGGQSAISLASEVLYHQRFNKWVIESNARFSGKHYIGQNRGLQTIQTRVRYLLSNQKQFSIGQYLESSNPTYYIGFLPRLYTSSRFFYEYSFRKKATSNTLKIQYQRQSLGAFYFTEARSLNSAILGYQTDYSRPLRQLI